VSTSNQEVAVGVSGRPSVSDEAPELVRVRVNWTGTEDAQPVHVNQALGQVGPQGADGLPDGIYVTMGVVPPPALLDEIQPEDRNRLLERLRTEGVKANVVGQFHMSRQMLGDLITTLQITAAKYDEAIQQRPGVAQGGGESE
jgi:hypothetical protein